MTLSFPKNTVVASTRIAAFTKNAMVKAAMESLPGYDYDHLFIDNASTDQTVTILRELAGADQHVKVIVNTRNFGHVRSPLRAICAAWTPKR